MYAAVHRNDCARLKWISPVYELIVAWHLRVVWITGAAFTGCLSRVIYAIFLGRLRASNSPDAVLGEESGGIVWGSLSAEIIYVYTPDRATRMRFFFGAGVQWYHSGISFRDVYVYTPSGATREEVLLHWETGRRRCQGSLLQGSYVYAPDSGPQCRDSPPLIRNHLFQPQEGVWVPSAQIYADSSPVSVRT